MNFKINDTIYIIDANIALKTFLIEKELPTQGVAFAYQEQVIPRTEWEQFMLKDGMELTMIQAVSGG